MRAYASASGGVMFVPDEVERTIPRFANARPTIIRMRFVP